MPLSAPAASQPVAELPREADVVVIGTGAGGAPAALTLARGGASVVMLERGPRYTHADFVHDEIRIARRNFFVPSVSTDPHVVVTADGKTELTSDGWISSCVGGGTVHMSGFFYRFHPEDFRVRDVLGDIEGATHANWPISFDELAPYYQKVEQELGVSGPATEGPWAPPRIGSYPLPPVDTHPLGERIDQAAKALGLHSFITPRAIISRPYRNRAACVYCHLCGSFGCEVGAKSSTLDTLIPAAEATGNCRVIPHAMVLRIETNAQGKATGVVWREQAGREHRLKARAVVVACSAIESARLLLLSTGPAHPEGLGNRHGQVGQHLMFSTLSKAHGSFRFSVDEARAEILKNSAPFLGRSLLDYYLPRQGPVKKAGALNLLFPSGGPIFQSESVALRGQQVLWGPALKRALHTYWHEQKQVDCETFGEYLPNANTRVRLDDNVKDQFGLPVARMEIRRHPHDAAVSKFLAARAVELLQAAGADETWTSNIGGRTMHLPMGGCRMGTDPRHSVVNAECRVHSAPNVAVTDGSVFVSSGGVPPTYTILANSFRAGDALLAASKRGDF